MYDVVYQIKNLKNKVHLEILVSMYSKRSTRLYKTILRGFSITGLEEGHIWAVFERSSYSKADGVTLKPTLWIVDNVKSSNACKYATYIFQDLIENNLNMIEIK